MAAPKRQRQPTSTGRKKIKIRPIKSNPARQVCFSKRRRGLFNKANELGILCGAEVAAVAFSPGEKAFSFGHPSVKSVLDRFLPSNSPEPQDAAAIGSGAGGDRNQALADLSKEHGELCARLEAEKARNDVVEQAFAKARAEGFQAALWLNTGVWQMGEEELVPFAATLEKVHDAVAAAAHMLREALLTRRTMLDGGVGFEFGSTSGGMVTMPPPPGFAAGMEKMPQGFGPYGFPQ